MSTLPAHPPGGPGGWKVLTASERGAAHVAVRTPNQDSVAAEQAGASGVVTAVADGHGHSRHLRSARGSRLAVAIGCQVGQELAGLLTGRGLDGSSQIATLADEVLVPAIVGRWHEAVLADVDADPFTDQEQRRRRPGDDPTIAYGSTLMLCLALDQWLILAQIGDGDVVAVRSDGSAALPIPADPQLDGLVTTSLCGPDAIADFRTAVVDTTRTPLLAVMLATDGYGNAQVVEDWPSSFSKDLAVLLRERDLQWLASQLPSWTARCASADGSADDTSVALLISPAGQTARPLTPPGASGEFRQIAQDSGSDEITIPAVNRTEMVPSGYAPTGPTPTEPTPTGPAPTEPTPTEPDTVRIPAVPVEPVPVEPVDDEPVDVDAGRIEAGQMDQEQVADPQADDQVTADWEPPAPSAGSGRR